MAPKTPPARRAASGARTPQRKRKGRYHHGDLRRALIDAAIELIAKHGPEAFTLREAARLVGVDHRAAYHHFDDKTALLAAVSEEGFRELAARTRAAHEAADLEAVERVERMLAGYIRFALEHPAHYRVMFAGPRLNETVRYPGLDAAAGEGFGYLVASLGEALGGGDEAAHERAIALWAMVHGYCELLFTGRIKRRSAPAAARHFRSLLDCVEEVVPRMRPRSKKG